MKRLKCLDILQKLNFKKLCGNYLPIIYTTSINYNPLINETFSESEQLYKSKSEVKNSTINASTSSTGQNASTSSSSSSGLIVNSDTPQGQISKQGILQGDYASSTQANENESSISDTTATNTSGSSQNQEATTNTGNENYTKTKSGFDLKMTKSDLIANYRKNIYNVNEKIIEDLNSLFFALF